MYVPAVDVSTEPEIDIDDVIFPSTASVAVAPGSVKVSPTVRLMVEEPVKVITGAVVSAATLTITVLVTTVAALPAASETLYDIVYVPAVDVSTEPEVVIEEVRSPSTSSVAVAPASV